MLTTRGRRSGRARSTRLYYLERDGTYFVAAGSAGSPIWSALVALYPTFERYQARTRRRIPVIRLQPMAG